MIAFPNFFAVSLRHVACSWAALSIIMIAESKLLHYTPLLAGLS